MFKTPLAFSIEGRHSTLPQCERGENTLVISCEWPFKALSETWLSIGQIALAQEGRPNPNRKVVSGVVSVPAGVQKKKFHFFAIQCGRFAITSVKTWFLKRKLSVTIGAL